MKNNFLKIILVLILIAVVIVIFILLNCLCRKQYAEPYPHNKIDSTSLVVWRNPDSTKESFKKWLAAFEAQNGKISETFYCKDCDSDLALLKGTGPESFIQGLTAGGGSTPTCPTCKPSGEDGPAFYSFNFIINIDDPISEGKNVNDTPNNNAYQNKEYLQNRHNFETIHSNNFTEYQHGSEPVVVAVIDTGLDTMGISDYVYNDADAKAAGESCLGDKAKKGWNFVGGDDNYKDDHSHKHGTSVAKLIINQAIKYQQNPVKILPIKVFGSSGTCDLFHVLCALAYANNRGAKIVNASFGYYAPKYQSDGRAPDSLSAMLFESYIKHYLIDSSRILMLCAAGNKDDAIERPIYNSTPDAMRNLDNVSFYPASFAGNQNMQNVIAVTTINSVGTVSPDQNYSPNIVDIGMIADHDPDWFVKPDAWPGTVIGSSFATPLAAGKIAANYNLISSIIQTPPTPRFSKNDIWNNLGKTLIQQEASSLQIKDKHSMERQKR